MSDRAAKTTAFTCERCFVWFLVSADAVRNGKRWCNTCALKVERERKAKAASR